MVADIPDSQAIQGTRASALMTLANYLKDIAVSASKQVKIVESEIIQIYPGCFLYTYLQEQSNRHNEKQ